MKHLISLSLLTGLNVCAMEIDHSAVQSKQNVKLYYDNGFMVEENGVTKEVNGFDVDPILRKRTKEQLAKYAAVGKFKVRKFKNGEYAVDAMGNINGGGPFFGALGYGLTKIICWGIGVAAVGEGANRISGNVGGLTGATTSTIATSATMGASNGASLVGAAIQGGGLGPQALEVSMGTVAAVGGSFTATQGIIEGVACTVGATLTSIPWLP